MAKSRIYAGIALLIAVILIFVLAAFNDSLSSHYWLDSKVVYWSIGQILVQFLGLALGAAALASIGSGLLTLAGSKTSAVSPLPRIFPETPLRQVTRFQKFTFDRSLTNPNPNSFALTWIGVLLVLLVIWMLARVPLTPNGIWAWQKEQGGRLAVASPWTETIAVSAQGNWEFLVNGQKVKKEELRNALEQILSRQLVRTIYVESNPNSMYMETVFIMDTAQGLGAKVIWITPKMRREWEQEARQISKIN